MHKIHLHDFNLPEFALTKLGRDITPAECNRIVELLFGEKFDVKERQLQETLKDIEERTGGMLLSKAAHGDVWVERALLAGYGRRAVRKYLASKSSDEIKEWLGLDITCHIGRASE
jgi:hypothetical protein